MKPGSAQLIASQRVMLATEHWRTDAVGDIVHQSASVMPRPEWQSGVGKGVDAGWQEMEVGRW